MALSFACVGKSRIGAFRMISMSLANRLVLFVSQYTVVGPARAAVALPRVSHQIRMWLPRANQTICEFA
jgi:hypothetical protein